jgi:hypothetical protein
VDHSIARVRTAAMLSACITMVFKATENARIARCGEIITHLEYLSEELIYLRRQVLELPTESSTALASEEDVPW